MAMHETANFGPALDSAPDSELVVTRAGPVVRLQLNRPRRANALSASLVDRLIEAVEQASREDARLLVFEGIGASFCSGCDLGDIDDQTDGDLAVRFLRIEILLQNIYHAPMWTVAFAQGRVFGAGADLFCACSVRIAAPNAQFKFPGPRFGLVLGTGRLRRCVGERAAQDLLLGGLEFSATKARDVGLATDVLDESHWAALVDELSNSDPAVAQSTVGAILKVLKPDHRAMDLASLALSVARPGLKDSILKYRGLRKGKYHR